MSSAFNIPAGPLTLGQLNRLDDEANSLARLLRAPEVGCDFDRIIDACNELRYACNAVPPVDAVPAEPVAPIDMVLHCPACGLQHVDAEGVDEACEDAYWANPPHRSHLCHGCDHIWRPADVPTNGVAAVKTKGKADKLNSLAASVASRGSEPVAPPEWTACRTADGLRIVIDSPDFEHDASLILTGDFATEGDKMSFAGAIADKLNRPAASDRAGVASLVASEEFCWLIELRPAFDGHPMFEATYYAGWRERSLTEATTRNPYEALRFATKTAAERVAENLQSTLSCVWQAVEHSFISGAGEAQS